MTSARRTAAVLCLTVLLASLAAGGAIWGGFTAQTANPGNSITAASDYRAPTTSARVIGKAAGGYAGFIRQGGTYNVYAQAADTGNPASGISSVTANVGTITTGQTAAALSSGSFSIGNPSASYNRGSATLTANSTLAAGTYNFSLTLSDAAGNGQTESGYTVTVDNTAPTASDVQAANGTGTPGRPDIGDTVTFSFSEIPEPVSILSGWTGSSTNVVVRINDNVAAAGGNDQLQIFNSANTSQLPLGSVNLGRTDYVGANRTFGASGTASTMAQSGAAITVTLGTQSGAGTTAASTGTMVWSPSSTATDRAGNPMSTATATETGAADKEF